MSSQNQGVASDQDRVVKGKSPRNALMTVGAIFALAIGAMGFYYQSKVSARAAEQAKEDKAAKTAAAVDRAPASDDIDRIIADQQARARAAEEKARRDALQPRRMPRQLRRSQRSRWISMNASRTTEISRPARSRTTSMPRRFSFRASRSRSRRIHRTAPLPTGS